MKKNGKLLLLYFVIAIVVLAVLTLIMSNRWIIIPVAILGIITISGTFTVPNNPKSAAIITLWNVRTNITYKEGLSFLPLRRIVYNYIIVDVTDKNIDFEEQILITPDNGKTRVTSSFSYIPDENYLINFLDIHGEEGLKTRIDDIEEEKLREWARSKNFGPQTWEELNNSKEEAIEALIIAICGIEKDDMNGADLSKIKRGKGDWSIPHLGIKLVRYNLTKMEPFGEIYDASVALNKEKKERKSENYEVETDYKKALYIQKQLAKKGEPISIENALKRVMEWKIQREANKQLSISAFVNAISAAMKGGAK